VVVDEAAVAELSGALDEIGSRQLMAVPGRHLWPSATAERSDKLGDCSWAWNAEVRPSNARVPMAVERANERIEKDGGCEPLPDGLSPHALRRTFASWLVAEGEDPAYVMGQLGHTDRR
jgi:integrase